MISKDRFIIAFCLALPGLVNGADNARDGIRRPLPEAYLVEVLEEIRTQRPEDALEKVNALINENPDFRLAQLVRGDLLLAMAEPIHDFGAVPGGRNGEVIADLRDEARVRWQRHSASPPADRLPDSLILLNTRQRHAVVVDLSASRLYLYENRGDTPKLVGDYYVTQGKNGAEKWKEGDRRTPIGVYRVMGHIPGGQLPDLYGVGAFPVDYPNEWDKRLGRTGSGIWLHGNPSDTYSRAPRASDGCVTLPNPDLLELGGYLDIGRTPVVLADRVEWLPPEKIRQMRDDLLATLDRWRRDWASRDSDRYLSHYSRDFKSGGKDYTAWADYKRSVNAGKDYIEVELGDISIFRYPGVDGEMVVVDFRQDYRSSNFSGASDKRQFWRKERDGVWRIVYEG